MDLAAASKSREITAEEARTWVGLDFAGKGQIKPDGSNSPNLAGFAVQGPVILLGNPDDHPIIKFLSAQKFLPYTPDAERFPGVGRGMVAWQLDGVGRGQESIALIAYDEAGMSEAVGTAYEAVAGMEPLTTFTWPTADKFKFAGAATDLKSEAPLAWKAVLPDRVLAIHVTAQGLSAITHDGSQSSLDNQGKLLATKPATEAELAEANRLPTPDAKLATAHARPDRMLKLIVQDGDRVAIAYWGGTLRIADGAGNVKTEQLLPQDITSLAWSKGQLLAGLADGQIVALGEAH